MAYKNQRGQKHENLAELLKNEMRSFNHFINIAGNAVICNEALYGNFFSNQLTGETLVASDYGISSFELNGVRWGINDLERIEKFLNLHRKISLDYASENSIEKENEVVSSRKKFQL